MYSGIFGFKKKLLTESKKIKIKLKLEKHGDIILKINYKNINLKEKRKKNAM